MGGHRGIDNRGWGMGAQGWRRKNSPIKDKNYCDGCRGKGEEGQWFASCRDGKLSVIREITPGKFGVSQIVQTPPGARTMDLDSSAHNIYLPTAEFQAGKDGGRPTPVPGTFMIVVVGPHGK